jgi:hypothetical protein
VGFSLKKLAQEAVAQANVFDHGKTAATVARNIQPAPPAQLPGAAPSIVNRVSRDITHNPLTNAVGGIGKSGVNTFEKSANTLGAGVAGLLGGANAGYQKAFGTDQSYLNALNQANAAVANTLTHGLGNKGGYLTPPQAGGYGDGFSGVQQSLIKPVAQGTADIAPWVVPAGAIGQEGKLLYRAGTQGALNAGISGATNATQQLVDTGHIDIGQNFKAAGLGGAIGVAFPVAGAGTKVVAEGVTTKLVPHVNGAMAAKSEAGAVGANVSQPIKPAGADEFKKLYKPAHNSPEEKFAADYIHNNYDKALNDYTNRTKQEFGNTKANVVAGDEAKFIVPNFGPEKSIAYHEPASQLAKIHYKNLLNDPNTTHQPVMIMAGGTGAGKTTSLRDIMTKDGKHLDDYAAVVDTNLKDVASAEKRIQPAIDSGRPVEINYIYRDPKEAYANGVIPRGINTKRVVTDTVHAETHAGSLQTIKELAAKYGDNPNLHINVIDNSRGKGNSVKVNLDFLKDKSHNKEQIMADVQDAINESIKKGQLTKEQSHAYTTQKPAAKGLQEESRTIGQKTSDQPAQTSKRPGFEQNLQKAGLSPKDNNRFTIGGQKGKQNLAPETQKAISGTHPTRNTKKLAQNAEVDAAKLDDNALIQQAHDRMAVKLGHIDDPDVAFAQQAIERADAAGRHEDATAIHDALSEHLVKNGQVIQAASLFYSRTPQGMIYKAEKDLTKAGVKLDDKTRQNIRDLADNIKSAKGEAKQRATAEMQKFVRDKIPKANLMVHYLFGKPGYYQALKRTKATYYPTLPLGRLKQLLIRYLPVSTKHCRWPPASALKQPRCAVASPALRKV